MAGENALSFGGSFGQGLASVLMEHRRTQEDKENQAFNAGFPVMIQHMLDTGDATGAELMFKQRFPQFAKRLEQSGGFQHLLKLQERFGPRTVEQPTTTPPSLSMAPQQQTDRNPSLSAALLPTSSNEVTSLTPAEEQQFQQWIQLNKQAPGIANFDAPESKYDMRGFWKDKEALSQWRPGDHFPDTYKQHGHDTFSVESKYSKGAGDGGSWNGDTFIPEKQPLPNLAPLLQQTPTPQAEPKGSTFFGQKVLSPEDRQKRAVSERTAVEEVPYNVKMAVAQRMVREGTVKTLSEALDRVGLQGRYAAGSTAMRYGGIMKGDQAGPDAADTYGRPLNPNMYYRVQIQPTGDLSYTPTVAPGGNLGVDREAISRATFGGRSFAQLTPPEQQTVLDDEKKRAGAMAETRALGTETGQFNAPIDVKTAQETNTQVGTSSADYAGQQIPTAVDRERVQDLGVIRGDLGRISDLLGILPSEKTLAGVAPGAVLAARRRMNSDAGLKDKNGKPIAMSYRTGIAQLEANVDSMVNLLARVRGRSVGTQTEQDAERAYNAVVQLKAGLTNPLGGDTQESARARITEALAGLDRVIAQLPAAGQTPVPKKAASPAPSTQPGGRGRGAGPVGVVTIGPDGKFYRDGVLDPALNP